MRNKSDIQSELYNRLNSPAWQSLRNSLIGRELIAYGTELLYMQDSMNSAVVNSFDYKHADERALISLAHTYDLGLCFTAPSWIRLRLPAGRASDVFPPFSIRCTIGSVVYTNINYYSGNQIITLYQGTVKTMYYQPGYGNISFVDTGNLTQEDWNTTDLSVEGRVEHVHNLGEAIPQSVFVFVGELSDQHEVSRVRTLSQFTPLRYGPDVYSFKEYTGFDGTLSVVDGDGIWGALLNGFDLYQIVWLEPSHVEVDVESARFIANGNPFDCVIISDAQGEDGVAFAREEFTRAIYKLLPVVSKSQIQEFVSAYQYVLDAEVVANANNVTVYVKPEDFSDEYQFGDIAAELDLRSQLGAEFTVIPGDFSSITVYIEGSVTEAQKTQIQSLILNSFRYEDMPFDWVPSASSISGLIQSTLGINVLCSFRASILTTQVSELTVNFLPIQGTLNVLDGSNLVVGHDVGGKIMAIPSESAVGVDKLFPKVIGKLFVEGDINIPFDGDMSYVGCTDIADSIVFPVNGLDNLPGSFVSGEWSPTGFNSGNAGAFGYYFTEDPNDSDKTVLMLFSNADLSADNYTDEKVLMYYAAFLTHFSTEESVVFAATIINNYVVVVEKGVGTNSDTIWLRYFELSLFNHDRNWTPTTTFPSISHILRTSHSTQGVAFSDNTIVFTMEDKLVLLDGNKALVIYNIGSVNVYSSVLSLEIDNEDLSNLAENGPICWGFNGETLGAIGYKDSKVVAYRVDSISVTNSRIVLSAITKLEVAYSLSGNLLMACTGSAAIISNDVVMESSQGYNKVFVDFKSMKIYTSLKTGQVSQIGTVNYSTGKMTFQGNPNYTIEFNSYNVVRPKGTYYMINEANPVIWNLQE